MTLLLLYSDYLLSQYRIPASSGKTTSRHASSNIGLEVQLILLGQVHGANSFLSLPSKQRLPGYQESCLLRLSTRSQNYFAA
jgi:hypothetical protein